MQRIKKIMKTETQMNSLKKLEEKKKLISSAKKEKIKTSNRKIMKQK